MLNAAKDLEDRIAPIAVRYAEVEKRNSELVNLLQQLESDKKAYEERVSRAESTVKTKREERDRLYERARGYLSVIKEKDQEIRKLQEKLDERDRKVWISFAPRREDLHRIQVRLMKLKLKSLARSQKRPSRQTVEDADASLLVEEYS